MTRQTNSNFMNNDVYPCLEEAGLSRKCLEAELYDYTKCYAYFVNYRTCKKFWGNVSRKRKLAGISPAMPTKEERDKILELRKQGVDSISA